MTFTKDFIQQLYRIGFMLVIILVLLDLLTFFYYPDSVWGDIFLATREQTPLTWLSALAFFFIALSSYSIYFKTKRLIWFFLAVTFFFFSMDDATYFHERLSGAVHDISPVFQLLPTYIWVVLYFPLLIFSLGAFIYLLWKDSLQKQKKNIVIALSLLGIAIALDLTDGIVEKSSLVVFCMESVCNQIVTHGIRLTEEVLEVFALGLLGYVNIVEHCVAEDPDDSAEN